MDKIKILVFDDSRYDTLLIYIKEALSNDAAYSVSFAANADSGLEEFKDSPFDAVIIKINLANLIEYSDLIRELKKVDPDSCIVVFLEEEKFEILKDLNRLGVYDILTQPIEKEKTSFLIKKGAEFHLLMLTQRKLIQRLHEQNDTLQKQNILLTNRVEASTKNLTKLYEDLRSTYMRAIRTLAQAIDARDHYTHSHSQNVAKYAVAIAEELQLSARETEFIREACELHDLGKIGVQDKILSKPDKLTPEEWEVMKCHPVMGAKILEPLTFLKDVISLIRQHHENYDGSGYPDQLRGEEISLGARIIRLADSYEAMRSARSYRLFPLLKQEAILEIKRNNGRQFDPNIVSAFLKVVDRFDPG